KARVFLFCDWVVPARSTRAAVTAAVANSLFTIVLPLFSLDERDAIVRSTSDRWTDQIVRAESARRHRGRQSAGTGGEICRRGEFRDAEGRGQGAAYGCFWRARGCLTSARTMRGMPIAAGNSQNAICGS